MEKKEDLIKNNISVLKIKDGKTVEQKIAELMSDPDVESVQPNFQYYPDGISTNDSHKDFLWGLDNLSQSVNSVVGTLDADIDAPEAWAINEGTNSTVVVAVIDTGVAYNHPDLTGNMWNGENCKNENGLVIGDCNYGYDFEDNDKTPLPTNNSHGTHVAGTIAAVKNNSIGIVGVAPRAKIMAIKTSLTTSNIILSINFAQQNEAKVINASWGGPSNDPLLRTAIGTFTGLFIAASGNATINHNLTSYFPCDFDLANIVCVAATNQNDVLATFSDYGTISVDVGAPGVNILSTIPSETIILNETFENVIAPAVPAGWTRDGVTPNKWRTFQQDNGSFWGKVLYGDTSSPYSQTANTTITSPTYNLSAGGSNIDFWTACDTEYNPTLSDYMALEFSNNSGGTFTEVLKWDEYLIDSNTNPVGSAVYHFQNLSIPDQYLVSNFQFRFRS